MRRELCQGIAKLNGQVTLIFMVAFLSRLFYVLLTVDPEWDGYWRFLTGIGLLTDPHARISFPFWLPLFDYLNAVLYWLTHSYLSVRIFSSICGSISTLLLYRLTLKISGSQKAALIAFVLMAFNPLIFLYDTTGMTEPLFTLLFLLTTYLFVINRILFLSTALAFACLTRYEAWFLTPIFYLVSLLQKRCKIRDIFAAFLIPSLSVCGWLYANYAVHGNPFHFYHVISEFLESYKRVQLPIISQHLHYEVSSLSIVAFLSPVWYIIVYFVFLTPSVFTEAIRGFMKFTRINRNTLALTIFASSYVLLLTYLMLVGKSVGWPRHTIPCMPFFILYAANHKASAEKGTTPKKFLIFSIILSLLILSVASIWSRNLTQPIIQTGNWLRENAREGRILCVSAPIMVLSGLPPERFIGLWIENGSLEDFFHFLRSHNVGYVVSDYGFLSDLCQNLTAVFATEAGAITIYAV